MNRELLDEALYNVTNRLEGDQRNRFILSFDSALEAAEEQMWLELQEMIEDGAFDEIEDEQQLEDLLTSWV